MTRSLPSSKTLALGLLLLGLAGCASLNLEVVAPSPTAAASSPLTRGRQLYVTTCAKCHAPEPVTKYSAAEWHRIMPEMVEETKLSPADASAVTAYVHWVLARR